MTLGGGGGILLGGVGGGVGGVGGGVGGVGGSPGGSAAHGGSGAPTDGGAEDGTQEDAGLADSGPCGSDGQGFVVHEYDDGSGQIVADDNHIYWLEWGPCLEWWGPVCVGGSEARLFRAEHCGENLELLVDWEVVHKQRGLTLGRSTIYWVTKQVEPESDAIWSMDKVSLARNKIATGDIRDVAAWQGEVYWIAGGTTIFRRVADGSAPESLVLEAETYALVVNEGGIFLAGDEGIEKFSEGVRAPFSAGKPISSHFFSATSSRVFWGYSEGIASLDVDSQLQQFAEYPVLNFVPAEDGRVYWTGPNSDYSRTEVRSASWGGDQMVTHGFADALASATIGGDYVFWVEYSQSPDVIKGRRR